MRVPKRNTGTDHSVVAMKGSNVPGAKGWVIQPDSEVNPLCGGGTGEEGKAV